MTYAAENVLEMLIKNMKNKNDAEQVLDINHYKIDLQEITQSISEIKKLRDRLDYISNYDELTGLPNSVYFRNQLAIECREARESHVKFAIMMLDIDGLKYFNYILGYDLGYKLIIEIVKRLMKFLGKNIFISRYSEDHFAIIVKELGSNREYENIAKGIINLFRQPFRVDSYELDVFVNIGISMFSECAMDTDTLRKQAKISLLRAKKYI